MVIANGRTVVATISDPLPSLTRGDAVGRAATSVTNVRVAPHTASHAEKSHTLSPEMMAEAAWRLGWLGLLYASTTILGYYGRRILIGLSTPEGITPRFEDWFGLGSIALGIAMYVVSRRGPVAPATARRRPRLRSPRHLLHRDDRVLAAGSVGLSIHVPADRVRLDRGFSSGRPQYAPKDPRFVTAGSLHRPCGSRHRRASRTDVASTVRSPSQRTSLPARIYARSRPTPLRESFIASTSG